MTRKRVLLVFANPLSRVRKHLPYGLMRLQAELSGHDVLIVSPFEQYADPCDGIRALVTDFSPDVVGLGIRNLDTQVSTEWGRGNFVPEDGSFATTYFVPEIRALVAGIREALADRPAPIVAGGGGFQAAPRALLAALGLRFGVVGPGEVPFRQFVERWPDDAIRVPGLIERRADETFREVPRLFYEDGFRERIALELIPAALAPNLAQVPIGVRTRYGCNEGCSYCLDPLLEGRRMRFREIADVVAQLEEYAKHDAINRVFFTDPEFNTPDLEYSTALLGAIIERGLHERFRFSSQFQPAPLTPEFADLLRTAGFSDLCISIDSIDEDIIRQNGKRYRLEEIRAAIVSCLSAGVPVLADFIVGMLGETRDTIDRTLTFAQDHDLSPRALKLNFMVGLRTYARTPLAKQAARRPDVYVPHSYGRLTFEHLEPYYVCFPDSPAALHEAVRGALGGQGNVTTGVVYGAQ